jgi:hypothetical protein
MVQLPKREESSSEFVLPDEGTYTVELDRLSEERVGKFEDRDGNYHPEQEFYFRIVDDPDFEGCELRVFVRTDTFYDGSGAGQPAKAYLIAKALLGPEFNPDEPPDTEDLVGRRCMGNIVHKKSVALDGSTRTYANLTGYAPLRKARGSVTSPRPSKSVNEQIDDLTVDDIPF